MIFVLDDVVGWTGEILGPVALTQPDVKEMVKVLGLATRLNLRTDMQHSGKKHKQESLLKGKVHSWEMIMEELKKEKESACCVDTGVWVSIFKYHLLPRGRISITWSTETGFQASSY